MAADTDVTDITTNMVSVITAGTDIGVTMAGVTATTTGAIGATVGVIATMTITTIADTTMIEDRA